MENLESNILKLLFYIRQHVFTDISLNLNEVKSKIKNTKYESDPTDTLSSILKVIGLNDIEWSKKHKLEAPCIILNDGLFYLCVSVSPQSIEVITEHGIKKLTINHDWMVSSRLSCNSNLKNESIISTIKKSFKSHKLSFFLVLALSIFIGVISVTASLYSMQVYDRVIPNGGRGLDTLIVLTIGVVLLFLIDLIMKSLRNTLINTWGAELDINLSNLIYDIFLRTRFDQIKNDSGELFNIIKSHESIKGFLSTGAIYITSDIPLSIITLFGIFIIGGFWVLIVPAILFLIALMAGFLFYLQIDKQIRSKQSIINNKNSALLESIYSFEFIKSSGCKWKHNLMWNDISHKTVENEIAFREINEKVGYFSFFIQQICYVSVVAIGASLVLKLDGVTMGAIVASSILCSRLLSPLAMLPSLISQYSHYKISLEYCLLLEKMEKDNSGIETPYIFNKISSDYSLINVTFLHGKHKSLEIDRLAINAGSKIALLGSVGSGKSTLLKLLAGLYQQNTGDILLNDVDLSSIHRDIITNQIGYCSQDTRLFSGTLRDNLTYGLPEIDDGELIDACKKTGLIKYVNSRKEGLNFKVAEGGKSLSAGQRQLVLLTRIFLMKPKIILLDEPTSSLDDYSEDLFMNWIYEIIKNDTTLIISTHKSKLLSLIDRVIVLYNGSVFMDGEKNSVIKKLSS